MWNGVTIAFFWAFSSGALAAEGQPVILRTQWSERSFSHPLVTLYGKAPGGLFTEGGSAPIYDYSDSKGCTQLLSKLVEFPLQKMRQQGYLSKDAYDFYAKLGPSLDARQVVYLNMTEVSSKHFEDGRSIMSNLLAPLHASSVPLSQRLDGVRNEWLNVKSSMWVVRDHVPDFHASQFSQKKKLPWQMESHLEKYADQIPESKMSFEFGRAAKDDDADYSVLVKTGATIAARDAISAGVALKDARIFIHTLNDKVARQMRIGYGLTEVALKGEADHLLTITVEDLINKVNVADFFFNAHHLKNAYPFAGSSELVRLEAALKKHTIHVLDDMKAGEGNWILVSNQNQGPYLHDSMMQINPRLNLMNIRNAPFEFDRMKMGTADHSVQAAVIPGNDWGIGNLDEIQFKKEPEYIERVLYEVNAYGRDLARTVSSANPYQLPEGRGFRIVTPSEAIANRAKALGAEMKAGSIPGHSMLVRKPDGTAAVNEAFQKVFYLHFASEKAMPLIRNYAMGAGGRTFRRGYHQLGYNRLNNL